MANLNYINSIAQRKMAFRSTTDVVVSNTNELFNCMSVYIPKRFAQDNIIGWNGGVHPETGAPFLTPTRPAVYVAVVDNYASVMTGDLLAQWLPVFRQDTNGDVILYLIVFDDEQAGEWNYEDQNISYGPLTAAFQALFPFSYFKFLFDPTYDGRDVEVPASAGTPAEMKIRLTNSSRQGTYARQDVVFENNAPGTGTPAAAPVIFARITNNATASAATAGNLMVRITNNNTTDTVDLPADTYTFTNDSIDYTFTLDTLRSVTPGSFTPLTLTATVTGPDPNFADIPASGDPITIVGLANPALPADLVATAMISRNNGVAASDGSRTILAGTYTTKPGNVTYSVTVPNNFSLPAGAPSSLVMTGGTLGVDPAWPASGTAVTIIETTFPTDVAVVNNGGNAGKDAVPAGTVITLEPGTYTYNDGSKAWNIVIPQEYDIDAAGGQLVIPNVRPTLVGFDPNLEDGADITTLFYGLLPPAGLTVTSSNVYAGENPGAGATVTIQAGTYNYNDGEKTFGIEIPTALIMKPDDFTAQITILASTVGTDTKLGEGLLENNMLDIRAITPALPAGIVTQLVSTVQGTNPRVSAEPAASQYFDMSLALAVLCRNNLDLSWMWSLVGISYDPVDNSASPLDKCWIRLRTRAFQLENMTSLTTTAYEEARSKFYWAALYLLQCQNTTVLVHSMDRNATTGVLAPTTFIIADILAAWFAQRNASGTFIGNKLSKLRLSGTRIKPLGYPSWLDSSIRENDAGTHILPTGQTVSALDELDSMNVGYLTTIADNTPQESALSMARGVGDIDKGLPVAMMMIAKYVDYMCAQEAAKLITATGTLTNPVLTDEAAYSSIQSIVTIMLGRFARSNGRIYDVTMAFPEFSVAKTARTALTAASAWKAWYKDDLDTVEVSGGITAE